MTTEDFILQHRSDDPRKLALAGNRNADIDMPFALNQIAGWQTAVTKLPSWARCEGIIYPPHISMEQCSSEQTALYKATLAEGETMVDLTGGFGVDFSFFAPHFKEATYVERQDHLCEIARHNFDLLFSRSDPQNLSPVINVIHSDSVEYLHDIQHVDFIYIDPARRDSNGAKTYAIEDCTPNVLELKDEFLAKANRIVIKLSPMLDWHRAVESLGCVSEVHIVSVGNECKELLLVLESKNAKSEGCKVVCVNDDKVTEFDSDKGTMHFTDTDDLTGMILCVPNASVMKAGIFGALCERYGVKALGRNSHLFVSSEIHADNNPWRGFFRINATTSMNKKELKVALQGIAQANIAVRNFPLSVQELRKRLKIKDGGNTYIFATTIRENLHRLLICEKL